MRVRKAVGIATGVAGLALLGAGLAYQATERAQVTEARRTLEQLRAQAGPDAERWYRLSLEVWRRTNGVDAPRPEQKLETPG